MIQAGTIRTGSADTFAVVGSYWISSMRSLRNTTLPGVTRHVAADLEALGPDRRPAGEHAVEVLEPVRRAAGEVEAALLDGLGDADRIHPRDVARRDHVDGRARHEGGLGLAVARQARHVARRLGPPGLDAEEVLDEHVERPLRPAGIGEPPVGRRRREGRGMPAVGEGEGHTTRASRAAIIAALWASSARLPGAWARCTHPVRPGLGERVGRDPLGGARQQRARHPVERAVVRLVAGLRRPREGRDARRLRPLERVRGQGGRRRARPLIRRKKLGGRFGRSVVHDSVARPRAQSLSGASASLGITLARRAGALIRSTAFRKSLVLGRGRRSLGMRRATRPGRGRLLRRRLRVLGRSQRWRSRASMSGTGRPVRDDLRREAGELSAELRRGVAATRRFMSR